MMHNATKYISLIKGKTLALSYNSIPGSHTKSIF